MTDTERDAVLEVLRRSREEAKSMTKEQAIARLQAWGFLTAAGELAPQYGGPGFEQWLEEHPGSYTQRISVDN